MIVPVPTAAGGSQAAGRSDGMMPVLWMAAVSGLSWLVVVVTAGDRAHPEVLYGMLGPLASACATWIAVERAHAAAPGRLMGVMLTGFALKMLFFGAYVAVMLRMLTLRPVPFVVSFTGYFIVLYAMEALFLKRLTTNRH